MANSIQYAKIASVPSVKVKTNELAGRVRVAFAEYEADAEQQKFLQLLTVLLKKYLFKKVRLLVQ